MTTGIPLSAIENGLPAVAFLIVVALVIVVAYFAHLYNKKREEEFRKFASQNGLKYSRHPYGNEPNGCLTLGMGFGHQGWHGQFNEFQPFGVGSSQHASHIFEGTFEGLPWTAFEYQYTTGSGKNRSTHTFSVAVITLPMAFHHTTLDRENVFTNIGKVVGIRDIEFESEEFNEAFYVKCTDKKFAYDLFHPTMMEYLLHRFRSKLQIQQTRMLIYESGGLDVNFLIHTKNFMLGFWQNVPDYLKADYGARR